MTEKERSAEDFFLWFETTPMPDIEIKISEGVVIKDLKKFVFTNMCICRANWRKKAYLPYLNRMAFVKKYIEEQHGTEQNNK